MENTPSANLPLQMNNTQPKATAFARRKWNNLNVAPQLRNPAAIPARSRKSPATARLFKHPPALNKFLTFN
jgi:hypothetical protein